MLRSPLLLVLLTHSIRTAYVTNTPSFAARLDRLNERIKHINAPTTEAHEASFSTQEPKWQRKLEKLNALSPHSIFPSPDEEDLLKMGLSWGLTSEQVDRIAKDLRMIHEEKDDRGDFLGALHQELQSDYYDMDEYPADYGNYRNDAKEDDDDDDPELSSEPPLLQSIPHGVVPSAITKANTITHIVVSAAESIAATNERPQVLEASALSPSVRSTLSKDVFSNIREVMNSGKCETPQPRWLVVRQLAPAADTIYLPPCVRLHRCTPDSGCCHNESKVCAPIEGKYVTLPFFLTKPDRTRSAHIMFYNHTKCACVSRDTLQTTLQAPARRRVLPPRLAEVRDQKQNDWRPPTDPPSTMEDVTEPPLMNMRRCTCPGQFMAHMPEQGPCACACEWPDAARRRDCLSLSRGDEHFGLRDRVCIENKDCTPPTCKFGTYDSKVGKCPARKYKRLRYHHTKRYHPEKALVV